MFLGSILAGESLDMDEIVFLILEYLASRRMVIAFWVVLLVSLLLGIGFWILGEKFTH